jgi:hypothetical protein
LHALDLLVEGKLAREVSSEQIAVRAWKLQPAMFAMKGYEDRYPDHHRVLCALTANGLVSKGFAVSHGGGKYSITEAGKKEIRKYLKCADTPPSGKEETMTDGQAADVVSAAQVAELMRLLNSPPCLNCLTIDEISFADAVDFWDLSGKAPPYEVALAFLSDSLRFLVNKARESGGIVLQNRRSVSSAEIQDLLDLHVKLVKKYLARVKSASVVEKHIKS